MKHPLVISIITLLSVFTQILSETDVGGEADTTGLTNLNIQKELEACNEHDTISKTYCKCDGNVVNCDFTRFPTQQPSQNLELSISGFAIPSGTRRVCICNTPNELTLTFGKSFLPIHNQIRRFDLYNLKGAARLDGGFRINFNGDLYLSNVTLIPEIHSYEFGKGDDGEIQNLQDVSCCSPIKVNQRFKKPLLFIENTVVGSIHSGGISDLHLWKTIILKSVQVDHVQTNGINSNNPQTDVAIIGSTFTSVANSGIHFEQTTNLFMARTYLNIHTNSLAWSSKSTLTDSNIVLLGNTFWYPLIHAIDAKRIVSWNNIYLAWDDHTFNDMKYSSFNGNVYATLSNIDSGSIIGLNRERVISIKYNTIFFPIELGPQSFQFSNGSQAFFTENVLGSCNCSQMDLLNNPFLKHGVNRCFAGNISGRALGKCSLNFEAVRKACSLPSAPNFYNMCLDKSIATNSTFPDFGSEVTTREEKACTNFNFIAIIMNEYSTLIGVSYGADLDGVLVNSRDLCENDVNSADSYGSSAAITIVITLTVLFCSAVKM